MDRSNVLLHFTLRPYNYDFKLEMFAAKVSPTHARVLPHSRDAAAPDLRTAVGSAGRAESLGF